MRFALIGVAGYIAPRHIRAIKECGHELVCAVDPHDSVGILDKFSLNTDFFTEFERFDRHCEKLRSSGQPIDWVSICSPNYLHDAHCRFALRIGANAICEKPLVIKAHNIDALKELETRTGKRIYPILQLRHNDEILKLRRTFDRDKRHSVKIIYHTPRGRWYDYSWKSVKEKSGGILMNIGVHFIDLLFFIFGDMTVVSVNAGHRKCEITLINDYVEAECDFSIESDKPLKKIFLFDGQSIDLASGFEDLHTRCYHEILSGTGYDIADVKPIIELINRISL